jgi:hypothetical protein
MCKATYLMDAEGKEIAYKERDGDKVYISRPFPGDLFLPSRPTF